MKKKPLLILFFVCMLAIFATGAVFFIRKEHSEKQTKHTQAVASKMSVVASFYTLAEFVSKVGGSRVSVQTLTPVGTEPHDFEPTPRDIIRLEDSQLFVFNGAGFEPWVEKIEDQLGKKIQLLRTTDGIDLLSAEETHHSDKEEVGVELDHGNEDHSVEAGASSGDPHVWLDPVLAMTQVVKITSTLKALDPKNSGEYEVNSEAYLKELRVLDDEFRLGLQNCTRREIVSSHAAFRYLAKRYNLSVIAISGLSSHQEPSPKRLAEIIQLVRKNATTHIFFEELSNPKVSEAIAAETGVKTLSLSAIEGLTTQQLEAGSDYLSLQRQNLKSLRTALDCK